MTAFVNEARRWGQGARIEWMDKKTSPSSQAVGQGLMMHLIYKSDKVLEASYGDQCRLKA